MTRVLPAEWAPQDAVLLVWPHPASDPAPRLDAAEDAFGALALALARFVPLVIACHDEATRARALATLAALGLPRAGCATVIVPSDTTRARDFSPITVLEDGRPLCIDCAVDGRGQPHAHARDAAFGAALLDAPGFATLGWQRAGLALAGGAVESDGAGTLLVNRPAVLDPGRNPGLDAATAERRLRALFGAGRVLWLDVPPLPGDDGAGRVDTLARFTAGGAIAHAAPHSDADPAREALETLAEQLAGLRTPGGAPYPLVALPDPEPRAGDDGRPLPAGYTGFVVANGGVLVPAWDDASDGPAVERLQACFPDHEMVPVPANAFPGAGGLHAHTMHWPHGTLQDLALV